MPRSFDRYDPSDPSFVHLGPDGPYKRLLHTKVYMGKPVPPDVISAEILKLEDRLTWLYAQRRGVPCSTIAPASDWEWCVGCGRAQVRRDSVPRLCDTCQKL